MLHYGEKFETRGRMDQERKSTALVTAEPGSPADGPAVFLPTVAGGAQPFGRPIVVPALVADVGPRAAKRFANFFGSIDNDNTRRAYQRACHCFFAWCDANGLDELAAIEPIHVGAYVKSMAGKFEKPTIKQHLAAIRMLFDYLVVGQILAISPAHAVRGPKHSIKRGKTPVLSAAQARQLLDSIDVSTVVGLRDRALIALMTFSFARVGAAVGMRVEDYFADGKRWRLRLNEKGGKVHEMPAHHNLEAYLDAYMHAAGLFGAQETPLFRSADWHGGALTALPMHRIDVWRMIRRRAAVAGIDADMCCHTFRATGLTNFLANGGTLENAQAMADHASPRTTQLYDRTGDEVTLDEVERIAIWLAGAYGPGVTFTIGRSNPASSSSAVLPHNRLLSTLSRYSPWLT
jgi:site-specific recombinase XerD